MPKRTSPKTAALLMRCMTTGLETTSQFGAATGLSYRSIAQSVRRLRLKGLVRRTDKKRGPGHVATYGLTVKGRKELRA